MSWIERLIKSKKTDALKHKVQAPEVKDVWPKVPSKRTVVNDGLPKTPADISNKVKTESAPSVKALPEKPVDKTIEAEDRQESVLDRVKSSMKEMAVAEKLEWDRLAPFRSDLWKTENKFIERNIPKRLKTIFSEAEKEIEKTEGVELYRKHIFIFGAENGAIINNFMPGQSEFGYLGHYSKSLYLLSVLRENREDGQVWEMVASDKLKDSLLNTWKSHKLDDLDIKAYSYFCTNKRQPDEQKNRHRNGFFSDYDVKLGYLVEKRTNKDTHKPDFLIRYFVGDGNYLISENNWSHTQTLNEKTLNTIDKFMKDALEQKNYKHIDLPLCLQMELTRPARTPVLPDYLLDRIHNENQNLRNRKNQHLEEERERQQLKQRVLEEILEREKKDPNFKRSGQVPKEHIHLDENRVVGTRETYTDEQFYRDLNSVFPSRGDSTN